MNIILKTKICSKCKTNKNIEEFYLCNDNKDGYLNRCKQCCSDANSRYHKMNSDKVSERNRKRYELKKEKILEKNNEYYKKNKNKISKQRLVCHQNRRKIDINYKLSCILRMRLNKALKNKYKNGSAVNDLGCSIEFFKEYIEKQFQSGMNWANYGKLENQWNIDHIKPLSKFDLTDRNQLLIACHYSNLQPMWAIDNMKKGDK